MAAGDIKGEEAICIEVTPTEAMAKGNVLHWEAADSWKVGALADTGPKGVAVDASANDKVLICIWGRVEVTADDTTIDKGQRVGAGAAGDVSANTTAGQMFATAMEDFAANGNGTIWVGLVR